MPDTPHTAADDPVSDAALIDCLLAPRAPETAPPAIPRPITTAAARDYATELVGNPVTLAMFANRCWDSLARAASPEVALSYERLIRQLTYAQGLSDHAKGKALVEQKHARYRDEAQTAREQRALARWVGKR